MGVLTMRPGDTLSQGEARRCVFDLSARVRLALARLLRKFFQNLRYGRERPKVARKLRSLAGGWAPLYGRAAAEEIFSEVI